MCIRDRSYTAPLFSIYPLDGTFDICGVQQMMRLFAARLTQIVFIKFLDIRILIGLAQRVVCIQIIKYLGALGADVHKIADAVRHLRLAAAVDTAAGAAHDLDKLVIRLAALDLLQQVTGIGKPRSHSHFHRADPGNLISGFLDSFNACLLYTSRCV